MRSLAGYPSQFLHCGERVRLAPPSYSFQTPAASLQAGNRHSATCQLPLLPTASTTKAFCYSWATSDVVDFCLINIRTAAGSEQGLSYPSWLCLILTSSWCFVKDHGTCKVCPSQHWQSPLLSPLVLWQGTHTQICTSTEAVFCLMTSAHPNISNILSF